MSNPSLQQLNTERQAILNGPVMQYLLSNCKNTTFPLAPLNKKVQSWNRCPLKLTSVIALSNPGALTLHTVSDFTRYERLLIAKNCIDFTLLSRNCIVLHQGSVDAQSHQSAEASSLTIYDLNSQLQSAQSMPLPLLVPQDAFIVAIELDPATQPALFHFAVVTSNKVLIYRHNNTSNTSALPVNIDSVQLVAEINSPAVGNILSAVFFSTSLGIMLVLGTEDGLLHFWSMETQQFCLRCNPGVGAVTTVVVSKLSPSNLFVGGQTGIVSHVKISDIVDGNSGQRAIAIAKVERIETPPDDEYDAVLSINFVRGCVYCVRESSYMKQLTPDQRHITAENDVYAMSSSSNQQSVVWCSEQHGMILQEWW